MLLVEQSGTRLLYTGDFKLRKSLTAEDARIPTADVLVMECTFGLPELRRPDRSAVVAELVDLVRRIMARGNTPIIQAYVFGKAQEVTRILSDHGIGVLQHPEIFALSNLYEQLGCSLGDYRLLKTGSTAGRAVIVPPASQKCEPIAPIRRSESIAVTGWVLNSGWRSRSKTDHGIALSDHAGFDELLELVSRVNPRTILCHHGQVRFVDVLNKRGFDARFLERNSAYCPLG